MRQKKVLQLTERIKMKKRAMSKNENPYGTIPCPICKEFACGSCKCIGPHSIEDLKEGHGFKCKNGHSWNGKGDVVDLKIEGSKK